MNSPIGTFARSALRTNIEHASKPLVAVSLEPYIFLQTLMLAYERVVSLCRYVRSLATDVYSLVLIVKEIQAVDKTKYLSVSNFSEGKRDTALTHYEKVDATK